ncbi:MAG TPA: hypothetical protein PKG90_16420, partial [Chitinophagaceae bacterium]|nr:hypothetical protein [Chitinophagaceae bacterium]
MRKLIAAFSFLFLCYLSSTAQSEKISVKKSGDDFVLETNGKGFFINGMNWDYFPVGTNFNYSLWK